MHHADLVRIDAQFLAKNRGGERLVALARGRRGDHRRDGAGAVDLHQAGLRPGRGRVLRVEQRLEGGVAAARLQAGNQADPGEPTHRPGQIAPRLQRRQVRHLQGLGEYCVIVAAVVFRAARNPVGKGIGGDEVPPPDLRPVQAQMPGHLVEGGLQGEVGRRLAEATDRGLAGLVGGDRDRLVFDARDPVGPDDGADRFAELQRRPAVLGAHILDRAQLEGADPARLIEGDLDIETAVGALHVAARHVFQPILQQPDRTAQGAGQVRHQDGVLDAALQAVAAADVDVVMGADGTRREAQRGGDLLGVGRHLDRGPDVEQPSARVPFGQYAEGLDRYRGAPPPARPEAEAVGQAGEIPGDRPPGEGTVVEDVGTVLAMDPRCVRRHRRLRVDDEGQGFVVDLDLFRRVLRQITVFRHDRRHPFADVAGDPDGQRPAFDPRRVERVDERVGRRRQFRPGQHRSHARHGQRFGRVDGQDLGVGVGALHECHVERARTADIGDEVPAPGDETAVLLGPALGGDEAVARRLCHRPPPPCLSRSAAIWMARTICT